MNENKMNDFKVNCSNITSPYEKDVNIFIEPAWKSFSFHARS